MIIGFFIFLLLAVGSVVGLLMHFGRDKKTRCKSCLQTVRSSQIVCNHCGTFLDKKMMNESKVIRHMERSADKRISIPIEKLGGNQNKDRNI
ncbi:hypothetical protein [Peribacillus alkalitolerans]|uniref:hypothetical protein n=1 Tax=Peribacillus alkalitolerans TaxID=1550385 RepID=UPI0013D57990|nr:hypothetical protein [Peribacillus alkalitolerans]